CLLTDFADAPSEHMPGDEELLRHAPLKIDQLNAAYGGGFAILHRSRKWNPSEGSWIGWERKRGKLEELNCFLMDPNEASRFAVIAGDVQKLRNVRFVFAIDDDNNLRQNSVSRLIGILAHPLNRAQFDESNTKITAGYGLLAPRGYLRSEHGNPTLYE